MNTLIWGFLAVAALFAAVGYALRVRDRRPPEEPTRRCHCPRCRERFSYLASQAGRSGACPRCKQGIIFPSGLVKWAPGRK
jgi:hypothetical protein